MEKDNIGGGVKMVVIGGSAGSLEVLLKILPQLKKGLHVSIIIVLHRKTTSDSTLTSLLASKTKLKVKEAEEKEAIVHGTVYVAPADYHLLIENDYTLSLDDSEKINFSRPSIDVTFECAAEVYGPGLACMLLSGANDDGTKGLQLVKEKNGIVVVQQPSSAEVPFMPQQAIERVNVDQILTPPQLAAFINDL